MPALNFQPRFAKMVENGTKRQTIRALRKDGRDPKLGDMIHLYTGMRTKKCRRLRTNYCTSVTPIHMTGNVIVMAMTSVQVDGKWLTQCELDSFDFASREEMRHWFFGYPA